ncbi:MAG: hypothetical protein IPM17_01250 [Verrucomicrobia bacterium]|nr:hypothetical protein [Verrucomicrobiota bacterium]
MPGFLELRRSSNWWYGVFTVNGRRQVLNLKVPITGQRPPKRTMLGDDEFERSRGRALAEYERRRRQFREERNTEGVLRKLVELKTGQEVRFPSLADLPRLWAEIPRRHAPGEHDAEQCLTILRRFTAFVSDAQPAATEFVAVTAAGLRPGDTVTLTDAPQGLADVRFRLLGVDIPRPESAEIVLTVREDTAHLLSEGPDVAADEPTDAAVLEVWDGGDLRGNVTTSPAGPYPLTHAALVGFLGSEKTFTVRAYLALGGYRSADYDSVTVTRS